MDLCCIGEKETILAEGELVRLSHLWVLPVKPEQWERILGLTAITSVPLEW